MSLKKVLITGLIFSACAVYATNARVEAMGKNATFIMDDMSIFDNPANIGIYPNYLIGEMGSYIENDIKPGENRDPQSPWFGGIFSMGLGEDMGLDPKVSIAGAFNRQDEWFKYLPQAVIVDDLLVGDSIVSVPTPITNFDGFLGASDEEGNLLGLHVYAGIQDGIDNYGNLDSRAFAQILKLDAGINYQYDEDIDLEIHGGLGRIAYGESDSNPFSGNLSFFGGGRMFSTIEAINGELVPAASFEYVEAGERKIFDGQAGMGVNVSLDRGFFWLGLEGIYRKQSAKLLAGMDSLVVAIDGADTTYATDIVIENQTGSKSVGRDRQEETGGRISFGIERNIWYDWFVIRVGGQKEILWKTCEIGDDTSEINGVSALCGESGAHFSTNPVGDQTQGDHIGFGFGINIEEKLKVDAVVSEDLIFRNPFQGGGRWLSRVSASYSF